MRLGDGLNPHEADELTRLLGDIANRAPAFPGRPTIVGYGHSFGAGEGLPAGYAPISVLGRLLGGTVTNRSVSSAILTGDESTAAPGGLGRILQTYKPTRTTGPDVPGVQIAVLHYGRNDAANFPAKTAAFSAALRGAISRLRASRVFEEDDSAVTMSANGSAPLALMNSGSTIRYLAGLNGWWQIAVPADFEGGAVTARFAAAAASEGTVITWTVDGNAAGTTTFDSSSHITNSYNSIAKRFTGLAPGAHVIRGTWTAGPAGPFVDCFEIESTTPPVVLLPLVTKDATVNGALLATFNQIIRDVAAEFDSRVIPVDVVNLFDDVKMLGGDSVHPSQRGAARIAAAMYSAISGASITVEEAALTSAP